MKKILFICLICVFSFGQVLADEIPNIKETFINTKNFKVFEITYPIRNNALITILQPCPDNSGDFMFTVCNKKSRCYQTSMLNNEIRYIGLFLEDYGEDLLSNLNKDIKQDGWEEEQNDFRTLYTDYMNCYDKAFGTLKSLKETKIKK